MTEQKEKQKKQNSVKKKPKKAVRNVLAVPYDKFWPVTNEEDSLIMKDNLEKILPSIKRTQVKIPWTELRKLSKQERVEKKKELIKNSEIPENKMSQYVIFGIKAVTRHLENSKVCCILLNSTVDPPLLICHIVTMAVEKKVPILLVPFLSSLTLETIQISAAALAFKSTVAKDEANVFFETYKRIVDIFDKISPPLKAHTHQSINPEKIDFSDDDNNTKEDLSKMSISTNVYLYRNSTKERTFVPRRSCLVKPAVSMVEEDFIAMSSDDESDNSDTELPSLSSTKKRYFKDSDDESDEQNSYKPLKVKKMHGNVNRLKATKKKSKK